MGLNESKGNMYDFVTHTWNTIKGKCPHDCSYCYMKRWKNQKPVRLDEKEFKTDLGKGNFIFVGSSCDMFAKRIQDDWILRTLEYCEQFDNNKYLFQSKDPERFLIGMMFYPTNCVFCTTIETNRVYANIMNNAPEPISRAVWFTTAVIEKPHITIEPIMDFDLKSFVDMIKLCHPIQVNIGADSSNNNLPEPEPEKIRDLILALSEFTIVKQKKNLKRLLSNE